MKHRWQKKIFSLHYVIRIQIDRRISTLKSKLSLYLQGAVVGSGFQTGGPCYFKMCRPETIRIGNNVVFVADYRSNRVGLTNPVVLETWGDGEIEIGDSSGGSSVVISARSKITIGQHVKLGGNVRIYDNNFHSMNYQARREPRLDAADIEASPVTICDDAFIGTNAIIMKGVTIGERAVIGAASVVTKDVPADEIWAGNPARHLKTTTS